MNQPIVRTHLVFTRTMYQAAWKRLRELGFGDKRGFSAYVQQLIRDDLKNGKKQ